MPTATDACMVSATVVLIALHILKPVRNAFSPKWRADARRMSAVAQQQLARPCRCKAPNRLAREIAARMEARQLRMLQQMLPALKSGACISMVLHVTQIHASSLPQCVLVMIFNVAILLSELLPGLVTERSMQVWFSCFMVFWPIYINPTWCSYETMRETWASNQMMMMLLSLARLHLPMVAIWSVVRTLCVYWVVAANGPSPSADGIPLLRYEIISLIGNILFVRLFAVSMEADCSRDLEGEATEEKEATMNTLLEMAYDFVVEVDQDFCIVNPMPSLSSFLLRPSPVALQHIPFEDLLFGEVDRTCFRAPLYAALGTVSSKEVFHLQMRDGNGAAIPIELSHFHLPRLSRRPRCILGFRERGDQRRARAAQGEQPVTEADQICEVEEVDVVVDAVHRQLPILDCSAAFNNKIMPMIRGSCFAPAVAQNSAFVAWLDATANEQYKDEYTEDIEGREGPPEIFPVEIMPRRKGGSTYMQALCSATLIKEALSSNNPEVAGQIRMRLTFTQLVKMPLRLRHVSSGRSSSSSSGSNHNCSSSHNGSQGRGTPMTLQQSSLGDHTAHGPQGPLHEAGGFPAARVAGVTICGPPLSL